ncbi:MAG: hypothetical protein PHF42_05205 [Pseudomonas sp.]|nr:hypothetical protein [Pseudomonas sp.]
MLKPSLNSLLVANNNECCFCAKPLSPEKATIFYMVSQNYGAESYRENAVVCCKPAKTKLEKLPLKERIKTILKNKTENQFLCSPPQKNVATRESSQPGIKKLAKLIKEQNGLCFFCDKPLSEKDASIEHLVAQSKGENVNAEENLVACCTAINRMLGNMAVKNKINAALQMENDGSSTCLEKIKTKQNKQQNLRDMEPYIKTIILNLRKTTARPRSMQALRNSIACTLRNKVSSKEVREIIKRLVDRKNISIDLNEKIEYKNFRYQSPANS